MRASSGCNVETKYACISAGGPLFTTSHSEAIPILHNRCQFSSVTINSTVKLWIAQLQRSIVVNAPAHSEYFSFGQYVKVANAQHRLKFYIRPTDLFDVL